VFGEHDSHRLLAAAGLAVAPGRLARSAGEAAEAARAVGMPVAMKGISPTITHRAAAGLVALDVASEEAARAAYDRLAATGAAAGAALEGILVQRMIRGGHDILVSAFRDATLGPMVSVGAGGNLTELIDDVAIARAPIDDDAAARLLRRLRSVRAIEKGRAPPPIARLASFVARLSQLAAGAPWRRFVLEVNPVKWTAEDAVATDGLLIVEEP
jgi:succinyl-CoA synthetase beta subunit